MLPALAPEPQFSHPVPPLPAERTKDEPAEPYTLSPGAAVAIAAAQLAEHPTQRGNSVAAVEGLLTADPVMVRIMLAAEGSFCKMRPLVITVPARFAIELYMTLGAWHQGISRSLANESSARFQQQA